MEGETVVVGLIVVAICEGGTGEEDGGGVAGLVEATA